MRRMYGEPKGGFQFLIGRLITGVFFMLIFRKKPFQFLIGRLITIADLKLLPEGLQFQFLIGRLITLPLPPALFIDYKVSIPHR